MLSDEEIKAIEILKDREYDFDELYCTFRQSFIKPYDKSIGIILELIEKQSKEIEELKEKIKTFKIEDENIYLQFGEITEKKRWKDKIKAKIDYLLKHYDSENFINFEMFIKILQSLLEKE